MNMTRKLVAGTAVATAALAMSAGAAGADHNHVVQTGNGNCVVLAQDGNEKNVELPDHLAGGYSAEKRHPLHVLVHKGTPAEHLTIAVKDSAEDPCASQLDPADEHGYVNAR